MSNRSNNQRAQRGSNTRRGKRKMRLFNIVTVRFRTNFLKHDYNAQELQLRVGEEVIVETSRGPVIALVESHVHRRLLPANSIPRVLRKASEADLETAERNEEREEASYRFALERVRARKLPMKLIRAQYMHDGSKIVFYFSADGRIDFRDLVKDLAHRFRTRIEMHQIGVRDGARMLGGIGPCGRELCCSTFLESFAPVSIRMAKEQGLTLNPKKVSGMCGRLMCCLVYEQALYKKKRRKLPRPGTEVFTEMGEAVITSVDVINSRVTVELADTNRKIIPLSQVAFEAQNLDMTVDADPAEPAYLWDDMMAEKKEREASGGSGGDDEKKQRRRRRSRGGQNRRRSSEGKSRSDDEKSGSKSGSSRGDSRGSAREEGGEGDNSGGKTSSQSRADQGGARDDKKSSGQSRRRRRRRGGSKNNKGSKPSSKE